MRRSRYSAKSVAAALLLVPVCSSLFSGAAFGQATAPAPQAAAPAAEPASDGQLADVIVTAERRETRLQETPIAVSVVSGADLSGKKILSVADLTTALPNVNINTNAGMTLISVRGIGVQSSRPGDDTRVAYYADDVYIPRSFAQTNLFDVDHIEVARGPQGTLFGRNATGGAFSVTSRAPTKQVTGYIDLTAGNYGLLQAEGAVGGPVTDTLGIRVAMQAIDRGGYGKNLYTGKDVNDQRTIAFRTTALWTPSSDFSAKLIGYYNRESDASYAPHIFAPVTPGVLLLGQVQGGTAVIGDYRDINSEIDPYNFSKVYGVTGNFRYDVSNEISLQAILGYQNGYHYINYDTDGTEMFDNSVFLIEDSKVYTAEFHVNGHFDRFKFTAGLYYFNEAEFVSNRAVLNAASFGRPYQPVQGVWSTADLKTQSWAAFIQASYDITDQFSITLGGRYSSEHRQDVNETRQSDFVRPYPPILAQQNAAGFPRDNVPLSFTAFDPKISLDYKITPDIFAYVSYSTAFKSGGYNYGQVQGPYFPEKIKAYEAGLKTTFFNRHARANISIFQYDYTNIQTSIQFFTPVTSLTVLNGPGARVKGIELEFTANPTSQLSLDFSGSILDSKYSKDFITGDGSRPTLGLLNLKGNTLPQSPKFSVNFGAAYTVPLGGNSGDLTFRGEYQRIGRTYHTVFNLDRDSQAPYNWVNAFITYKAADHWTASLFVRNLTNSFVKQGISLQSGILGGGGGYSLGSEAPPRTFGGSIGYKF